MKYSISDLEQLSGVQTHTIRIWERRYHALEPMRSAGNTRFYDDNQLRRLLNIVGLSQTGLKISQVCALSNQELDKLLSKEMDQLILKDAEFEYYIVQLLSFGLAYNEYEFDLMINVCINVHGLEVTYKNVMYPLLVRMGLMWRRDHICPAQEHFMSNILRQKLYNAIDGLPLKQDVGSSWLLFLPEDEGHDIGLLFANYMLKAAGQRVIFLGGRVPLDSVKDAMRNKEIDHLLLFMVRSRPINEANDYLNELCSLSKNKSVHIAGNYKLISELELASNIRWFQSIEEFEKIINTVQHVN